MKHKECKITCDGKEMATIKFTENGLQIEHTELGKKLMKECCANGCC
jgi:hypothetical protein